jgi:hypothetical protein
VSEPPLPSLHVSMDLWRMWSPNGEFTAEDAEFRRVRLRAARTSSAREAPPSPCRLRPAARVRTRAAKNCPAPATVVRFLLNAGGAVANHSSRTSP